MCVGGMQRCAYLSELTMRNIDEWWWRGPGTGQWLKTSSSEAAALLLHAALSSIGASAGHLVHLMSPILKYDCMCKWIRACLVCVGMGATQRVNKKRPCPLECWLQTSSRQWPGHRISPAKCVQLCVRMCAISPDTGVIFIALLSTSADKQQEAWAARWAEIVTEKLLSGLQFTVAPCQY